MAENTYCAFSIKRYNRNAAASGNTKGTTETLRAEGFEFLKFV